MRTFHPHPVAKHITPIRNASDRAGPATPSTDPAPPGLDRAPLVSPLTSGGDETGTVAKHECKPGRNGEHTADSYPTPDHYAAQDDSGSDLHRRAGLPQKAGAYASWRSGRERTLVSRVQQQIGSPTPRDELRGLGATQRSPRGNEKGSVSRNTLPADRARVDPGLYPQESKGGTLCSISGGGK